MTGNEIKQLRQSCGFTVAQFADVCGVHRSAVNKWEACGKDSTPKVAAGTERVLVGMEKRGAKRIGNAFRGGGWRAVWSVLFG